MGELLGVAGTDVPIAEIVKLVPPHSVRKNQMHLVIWFSPSDWGRRLQLCSEQQWTSALPSRLETNGNDNCCFFMGCLVLVLGWLTWICFSIVQLLYLQFSGEILKPNYNSVDMVEVELVDDHSIEEPRQNSSDIFLVILSVSQVT